MVMNLARAQHVHVAFAASLPSADSSSHLPCFRRCAVCVAASMHPLPLCPLCAHCQGPQYMGPSQGQPQVQLAQWRGGSDPCPSRARVRQAPLAVCSLAQPRFPYPAWPPGLVWGGGAWMSTGYPCTSKPSLLPLQHQLTPGPGEVSGLEPVGPGRGRRASEKPVEPSPVQEEEGTVLARGGGTLAADWHGGDRGHLRRPLRV